MGAAYACVGFTSLAAAATFANYEAGSVLFLQTAFLSMIGCIVRPSVPAEFYNAGKQDGVQSSQMVATVMGYAGALTLAAGLALKRDVPTPVQYAARLLCSMSSLGKEEEASLRIEGAMAKRTPTTSDVITREL